MANQIKIKRIAVGTHELSVTLLDSNGRIWTAMQNIGKGGVVDGWYNNPSAGAVDMSIDSSGTTWLVNPEGKIYSNKVDRSSTQNLPEWTDESLKDSQGRFVKAEQISTGDHYYEAIDEKKRLWGRTLPHPGAGVGITDSGWMLDKTATNVKKTTAGYRSEDTYILKESGELYRWQNGSWASQEISEGSDHNGAEVKKLGNLKHVAAIRTAQIEETQFWQSGLFYMTNDGHVHQPSGLRAHSGVVYYEDSVGVGVDFAVIDVNDMWMVNEQGDIYRRTKERHPRELAIEGEPIPVTVQGEKYYWSKYKGPDFNEARIYWVQPGDTFNQIAADHGLTPAVLKARNKQVGNVDRIKAGERLKLV